MAEQIWALRDPKGALVDVGMIPYTLLLRVRYGRDNERGIEPWICEALNSFVLHDREATEFTVKGYTLAREHLTPHDATRTDVCGYCHDTDACDECRSMQGRTLPTPLAPGVQPCEFCDANPCVCQEGDARTVNRRVATAASVERYNILSKAGEWYSYPHSDGQWVRWDDIKERLTDVSFSAADLGVTVQDPSGSDVESSRAAHHVADAGNMIASASQPASITKDGETVGDLHHAAMKHCDRHEFSKAAVFEARAVDLAVEKRVSVQTVTVLARSLQAIANRIKTDALAQHPTTQNAEANDA